MLKFLLPLLFSLFKSTFLLLLPTTSVWFSQFFMTSQKGLVGIKWLGLCSHNSRLAFLSGSSLRWFLRHSRVLLPAFQNCLQHAWCSSKLSTVSQVSFSVIFHHLDVSEKYH